MSIPFVIASIPFWIISIVFAAGAGAAYPLRRPDEKPSDLAAQVLIGLVLCGVFAAIAASVMRS